MRRTFSVPANDAVPVTVTAAPYLCRTATCMAASTSPFIVKAHCLANQDTCKGAMLPFQMHA